MPKAFFVIVPAGKGDGARGEEGNAAFASEPFPSSPRHGFPGYVKPIQKRALYVSVFLKNLSDSFCENSREKSFNKETENLSPLIKKLDIFPCRVFYSPFIRRSFIEYAGESWRLKARPAPWKALCFYAKGDAIRHPYFIKSSHVFVNKWVTFLWRFRYKSLRRLKSAQKRIAKGSQSFLIMR